MSENLFKQHNGWADNKLAEIKAAGQSKTKRYVFLTSCVEADGDAINEMVENAVPVQYDTMLKYCDMKKVADALSYERRKDLGLTLRDDTMVGFYKSTYRGCPCYFLDHSAIEYIWVDREKWEPERMVQRG